MFRFTQEPSSGSHSQYLAKLTGMVPLCLSMCALPVLWRHILTCFVCARGSLCRKVLPARRTTHTQNGSEYAAVTLATHILTSAVEPCL